MWDSGKVFFRILIFHKLVLWDPVIRLLSEHLRAFKFCSTSTRNKATHQLNGAVSSAHSLGGAVSECRCQAFYEEMRLWMGFGSHE